MNPSWRKRRKKHYVSVGSRRFYNWVMLSLKCLKSLVKNVNMEETARKMLADNFKLSNIIKYTGIDVDRISKLRDTVRQESLVV